MNDEPEVASVPADLLSADGHQVETAADGPSARERLRERSYDLILSDIDIRMPGLDGICFLTGRWSAGLPISSHA